MDIPCDVEAHAFTNTLTKSIWSDFQFFYALRLLFLDLKHCYLWEFINLAIKLAVDVSLVYFWGWTSLAYLILPTFLGGGMHPIAGHFISEHHVLNPDQETYSYYGTLNLMTWSVGYRNENHDFPRIPGISLSKLNEIAPEYYKNLRSYRSGSQVICMHVRDGSNPRTMGWSRKMIRTAALTSVSSYYNFLYDMI